MKRLENVDLSLDSSKYLKELTPVLKIIADVDE